MCSNHATVVKCTVVLAVIRFSSYYTRPIQIHAQQSVCLDNMLNTFSAIEKEILLYYHTGYGQRNDGFLKVYLYKI